MFDYRTEIFYWMMVVETKLIDYQFCQNEVYVFYFTAAADFGCQKETFSNC